MPVDALGWDATASALMLDFNLLLLLAAPPRRKTATCNVTTTATHRSYHRFSSDPFEERMLARLRPLER